MINFEFSVYLSGLHQIKTRVFVGSVLHITPLQPVLCNVGVSGERRRSAARLSSPGPGVSGVHILPGERAGMTTIKMTEEICPKCAMRRKRVLGYVQEGKVLKVVLSIKFIWGRDILYPRPSKID